MPAPTVTVDVHITEAEWSAAMVEGVVTGLGTSPKTLSPVWFYDERGSALFDQITRLPEYYPTEAERSLLTAHAPTIADITGADTLVELGSGTSDKTTSLLSALAEAGSLQRYVPFDVSEPPVREAGAALVAQFPHLAVHGVIGDFHQHLGRIPGGGRRLLAFLGSTIGNFEPEERRRFLADVAALVGPHDHFLLGADLVKDPEVMVAAYDDGAGVTAAFNRNALTHLNHRLGADFDPDAFTHQAIWNESASRIEMHLRATSAQRVTIPTLDLSVSFDAGETIRSEISTKFSPATLAAELADLGLDLVDTWTAPPGFQLLLARPR